MMKVDKKLTPMTKLTRNKAIPKRAEVKMEASGKNATELKMTGALRNRIQEESRSVDTVAFAQDGLRSRSGEQSGDLQGLSNVQSADSESVDELLGQGNAFEAEVVTGVEDAEDADEGEVRTHEVP